MKKRKKRPRTCTRCGSPATDGLCRDETCPFSEHLQSCPAGWVNHPDGPGCKDNACHCGGRIKAEVHSDDHTFEANAAQPPPTTDIETDPAVAQSGRNSTKPRTIVLPCFNIIVRLPSIEPSQTGLSLAGEITSSLHEGDSGSEDDSDYEAAIDGIESLILAHACAGVDITVPAYVAGIQTAVEAASGRL